MTRQARSRTVDEQVAMLRQLADPAARGKMLGGCLGLIALVAAGLVVAAALRRDWGLLPFLPFLALLGVGIWHSARRLEPALRRARYALDLGRTARGTVHLTITGEGEDIVYEARARDLGAGTGRSASSRRAGSRPPASTRPNCASATRSTGRRSCSRPTASSSRATSPGAHDPAPWRYR